MIYIFDDSRKACRGRHYKAHLLFESWYLHRTFDKVINDCIYVLLEYLTTYDPNYLVTLEYNTGWYYRYSTNEVSKEKTPYNTEIYIRFINDDINANRAFIDMYRDEDLTVFLNIPQIKKEAVWERGLRGILAEEFSHLRDFYTDNASKRTKLDDIIKKDIVARNIEEQKIISNVSYNIVDNILGKFNIILDNDKAEYRDIKRQLTNVLYLMSDTEFVGHLENFDKIMQACSDKEIKDVLDKVPTDTIRWNKGIALANAICSKYGNYFCFSSYHILEQALWKLGKPEKLYMFEKQILVLLVSLFVFNSFLKDSTKEKVFESFSLYKSLTDSYEFSSEEIEMIMEMCKLFLNKHKEFIMQLHFIAEQFIKENSYDDYIPKSNIYESDNYGCLFICRGEVNYYSRHFNIDDNVLDEALMTNNADKIETINKKLAYNSFVLYETRIPIELKTFDEMFNYYR